MKLQDQIAGLFLLNDGAFERYSRCLQKLREKSKSYPPLTSLQRRKNRKISKSQSELLELFNEITAKTSNPSNLYLTLKKLDSYKNVLARLLEAYIYMRVANSSKAQLILTELMQKNFFEHIYGSDLYSLSLAQQIEKVIYLLKAFEEDLSNEKLVTALIHYFHFNTTGQFQVSINEEFEVPRGLKNVRNYYRSNNFGKTLPFVWGPWIFENSSQKELLNYLQQTSIVEAIQKGRGESLLFYRGLSNIQKSEQKAIIDIIDRLHLSSNLMDQFIFFEMVDDDTFYKFVTAHSKLKIGIITAGKRKFFRSLRNIPSLKEYSLFQLLYLGDQQDEYLSELLD